MQALVAGDRLKDFHYLSTVSGGGYREQAEDSGGLPTFATKEVDESLRCGLREHGFLRFACTACGHERLVAFSCKRRAFCPSCLGRRMTDTALHLTEKVFPKVMVRQWVCSLPWGLRALFGYDKTLCSEVLRPFSGEVQRSLRLSSPSPSATPRLLEATTSLATDKDNPPSASSSKTPCKSVPRSPS